MFQRAVGLIRWICNYGRNNKIGNAIVNQLVGAGNIFDIDCRNRSSAFNRVAVSPKRNRGVGFAHIRRNRNWQTGRVVAVAFYFEVMKLISLPRWVSIGCVYICSIFEGKVCKIIIQTVIGSQTIGNLSAINNDWQRVKTVSLSENILMRKYKLSSLVDVNSSPVFYCSQGGSA